MSFDSHSEVQFMPSQDKNSVGCSFYFSSQSRRVEFD